MEIHGWAYWKTGRLLKVSKRNEAPLQGGANRFATVARIQFLEDIAEMGLDR